MIHRPKWTIATVLPALLILAAGNAHAQYHYGKSRGSGGSGEEGIFASVELISANPRNTDAVVATTESIQDFGGGINRVSPVIPDWDDEVSARATFGYRWAGGSKISVSYWDFEADQSASGDGPAAGFLHFGIGPPIRTGGSYVGNRATPGFYDIQTDISASTIDAAWGKEHTASDRLNLEWSIGLRYAEFEEIMGGIYDEAATGDAAFGSVRYDAAKSNQGEMVGGRVVTRISYRLLKSFSVTGGLAISFLDGELTADSRLTPIGSVNRLTVPTAAVALTDDGRSGSIFDFDVGVAWHASNESLQVSLGWEQSEWNDIAADLVRNFPGTTAPLHERDSVIFSGYKLGVHYRF